MAIASLIISIAGLVFSFILGFPLNYFLGPIVGLVMGIVGLILAAIAHRQKRANISKAALIVSAIVTGICAVRFISVITCMGRITSCVAGLIQSAAQ